MRTTTSPRTRLLARLILPLMLVAVAGLAAQEPPRKKLPKPEIEDPNPRKLKEVPDPEKAEPKTAAKQELPPSTELGGEAQETTHPVLRELFRGLAVPHDLVIMRQSGRTNVAEPIPQYVGDRPRFKNTIPVQLLDERDFRRTAKFEISAT